jgi:hypothetical protein
MHTLTCTHVDFIHPRLCVTVDYDEIYYACVHQVLKVCIAMFSTVGNNGVGMLLALQ